MAAWLLVAGFAVGGARPADAFAGAHWLSSSARARHWPHITKAGPADVYAEASRQIPPDWIRLVVGVGTVEASEDVKRAVAEVSESLIVDRAEVRSFKNQGGRVQEAQEWILSVWVPPKSMLLISSMIGEVLFQIQCDTAMEAPMLLCEGLEFSGEPDFLSVELGASAVDPGERAVGELLAELGQGAVNQRFAACAHLDGGTSSLSLRTSAAGRRGLERWLPSQGVDISAVAWTPVGGDGGYLGWVSEQTMGLEDDATSEHTIGSQEDTAASA